MLLAAPVLQSHLSCVDVAALAVAEFVGAYRSTLQLLGMRTGSLNEKLATLDANIFFLRARNRKSTGSEAGALDPAHG